jgi:hypothetical protein
VARVRTTASERVVLKKVVVEAPSRASFSLRGGLRLEEVVHDAVRYLPRPSAIGAEVAPPGRDARLWGGEHFPDLSGELEGGPRVRSGVQPPEGRHLVATDDDGGNLSVDGLDQQARGLADDQVHAADEVVGVRRVLAREPVNPATELLGEQSGDLELLGSVRLPGVRPHEELGLGVHERRDGPEERVLR